MKARGKFRRFDGGRINRAAAVSAKLSAELSAEASKGPRQVIEQAARDIGRGLRDTDLHGIPSNVPGPGPAPEHSPGAEVPPDGVDQNK